MHEKCLDRANCEGWGLQVHNMNGWSKHTSMIHNIKWLDNLEKCPGGGS